MKISTDEDEIKNTLINYYNERRLTTYGEYISLSEIPSYWKKQYHDPSVDGETEYGYAEGMTRRAMVGSTFLSYGNAPGSRCMCPVCFSSCIGGLFTARGCKKRILSWDYLEYRT